MVGVGRVEAPRRRSRRGLLVGDLLQGVAQVAQRCGEQAGQGADRRLHPAGQLGQQDLARRQRREPGDVVGADRPVAEDAAGDPDDPGIRTGGVEDGLGGPGLVVAERDRGRSDQQRPERLADRVVGGDPHQPVLDDAIRHVLLAQGAPDLGDLLDLEAAVLGDDHRPGVGEFLAQLGDGLPFGLRGHVPSFFGTRPACGGGAPIRTIGWPLRRSHGGLLERSATPLRRDAAHPKVERHRLPRRARRRPRPRSRSDPVRRIKPRPSPTRRSAASAGAGCLWRSVCMVR